MLCFGSLLGVPGFLGAVGVALLVLALETAGGLLLLLSTMTFVAAVVVLWVLIFQARGRLQRAEALLYAGDLDGATREAVFVVRTVFRSDYQTGALFTLALAAERLGAFAEAGALFARAIDMIPAMAALRPGRRARALLSAHATLSFAAADDLARANAMIARCYVQLGPTGQPGALEGLLDDSYMGAIGINSILVELENRRDPRPLAVLASALLTLKNGQPPAAVALLDRERMSVEHGLAPHERALAERIRQESLRLASGAGPHRSPGPLAPVDGDFTSAWAARALPLAR
jgi:hypothetical protein